MTARHTTCLRCGQPVTDQGSVTRPAWEHDVPVDHEAEVDGHSTRIVTRDGDGNLVV